MKKLIVFITSLLLVSILCIPVLAVTPRITDNSDLLSSDEESVLEQMAAWVTTQYSAEVAIHTTDSIGFKSMGQYSDDYYDDCGYGVGDDSSGIILVICLSEREIYISTCGPCGYSIDDYEVEEILDVVYNDMSEGNYYQACRNFIIQVERYLDAERAQGNPGENAYYEDYYGSAKEEDAGFDAGNAAISVLIGAGGGGIGLASLRSGMNTAVSQQNAQNYVDSNSYQLTGNQNTFLYSNVTRVRRSTSQNSGTGRRAGGSMHTSSAGKNHGGGGRKF